MRTFQGPALVVFNDAVFTDADWKGIKMLLNSVKKDDPMKVGRFGMGFKSTYHVSGECGKRVTCIKNNFNKFI